jgi:AraC-like DNA-binding protein
MEQNIYSMQLSALSISGEKVSQNLYELRQLAFQIGINVEIRKYSITANPLDDPLALSVFREAFKFLQIIKTTNTLFDEILLYAPKSRTMLWETSAQIRMGTTYGGTFSIEGKSYAEIEEFLNRRYQYAYLSGFNINLYNKEYQNPFILVYTFPATEEYFLNLFLFISQQKFLEPFSVDAGKGEWVFVLENGGSYIASSLAPDEEAGITLANKADDDSGFFIDRKKGEKYLITYMRDNRSGFVFVSGVPHRRVLEVTGGFRLFVTVLLVLSITFGLGIALLMAVNSARPIKALYRIIVSDLEPGETPVFSYDFLNSRIAEAFSSKRMLESEVNRLAPAQKQSQIYRLLNMGANEYINIQEEFNRFGIDLRQGIFCVLIIAINDVDTSYGFSEISAYKVLIDKAIAKTKQDYIGIFHNETDKETILINYPERLEESLIEEMEQFAGAINKELMEEHNISITWAGSIADKAEEISRAYFEAAEALKSEISNNNMKVLWFKALNQPGHVKEIAVVENKAAGNNEMIEKIMNYINDHFTNPQISLFSVADEFGITEFYLSHLFKEKSGINFSKYLEKTRMDYAQMLLAEKHYKVVDAALEAGYSSHQAFGRAYHKYFGKSPSAYNNRVR